MHAHNSSGQKISLLNDEPSTQRRATFQRPVYASPDMMRSNSAFSESSSAPRTPDLLRADSYDSQMTNDGASPITPSYEVKGPQSYPAAQQHYPLLDRLPGYEYGDKQRSVHAMYIDSRHAYAEPSRYDEEQQTQPSPAEGSAKRYPCRFKELHGCDKTFTTSGHASRHSKIHTAEKAVHCSFDGCMKKFTRADNMKQHLETHYKERSRALHAAPHSSPLLQSAGIKKSTPQRLERPNRYPEHLEHIPIDPNLFAAPCASPPAARSPSSAYLDTYSMHGFQHALPQPMSARTESASSGLDALAAAVACQPRN